MVEVAVQGVVGVDPDTVRPVAESLLTLVERPDSELSVVLCDDAFITTLNARWREVDGPTDVLSFPQDDAVVLGDVVISVETAARQAAQVGHAVHRELCVLLVHGVLHLLGHDHDQPEALERMRGEEARLLAAVGIGAGSGLVGRQHDG